MGIARDGVLDCLWDEGQRKMQPRVRKGHRPRKKKKKKEEAIYGMMDKSSIYEQSAS